VKLGFKPGLFGQILGKKRLVFLPSVPARSSCCKRMTSFQSCSSSLPAVSLAPVISAMQQVITGNYVAANPNDC
jgi:hypothetical protein